MSERKFDSKNNIFYNPQKGSTKNEEGMSISTNQNLRLLFCERMRVQERCTGEGKLWLPLRLISHYYRNMLSDWAYNIVKDIVVYLKDCNNEVFFTTFENVYSIELNNDNAKVQLREDTNKYTLMEPVAGEGKLHFEPMKVKEQSDIVIDHVRPQDDILRNVDPAKFKELNYLTEVYRAEFLKTPGRKRIDHILAVEDKINKDDATRERLKAELKEIGDMTWCRLISREGNSEKGNTVPFREFISVQGVNYGILHENVRYGNKQIVSCKNLETGEHVAFDSDKVNACERHLLYLAKNYKTEALWQIF